MPLGDSMKCLIRVSLLPVLMIGVTAVAEEPRVLFDGTNTDAWEFREGSWSIDDSGSLHCHMEEVTLKNGNTRTRGMGYIWTRESFGDFELSLSYKLSEAANSGVFFRTDPNNPVQGGFEIQLMDDEGIRRSRGELEAKKLNGSLYDCQAASSAPGKPAGQWNDLKLTCRGPMIRLEINGETVNEANVDRWDTPMENPDGSKNKFKTALKDLPRSGRIGFQNHGQVVWFKDVKIRELN